MGRALPRPPLIWIKSENFLGQREGVKKQTFYGHANRKRLPRSPLTLSFLWIFFVFLILVYDYVFINIFFWCSFDLIL